MLLIDHPNCLAMPVLKTNFKIYSLPGFATESALQKREGGRDLIEKLVN